MPGTGEPQIEFVLLTGSTLRQVRQHFQAFFELRYCLHHRRARQRLLTRLKPVADSLLVEARLGAMCASSAGSLATIS
jgi:hypothetical protein